MWKFKTILKRLFFPMTLLTFLVIGSVFLVVNALYIWITQGGETAIYPAVTIPIMLFFIGLYFVDRWLINKITYVKIMIGEGLILVGVLFFLLLQNRTTDINFYTDQDYVLVLFDAENTAVPTFDKKWIFGKELNVTNTNILHLNTKMLDQKDMRINGPKNWEGFIQGRAVYKPESDSIPYIFVMKHKLDTGNWKRNQVFIESIIEKEYMR